MKENQEAANQGKDLLSLFKRRFNELEKKIEDKHANINERNQEVRRIDKIGQKKFNKRKLCRDRQVNRKSDHPRFSKDTSLSLIHI